MISLALNQRIEMYQNILFSKTPRFERSGHFPETEERHSNRAPLSNINVLVGLNRIASAGNSTK